MQKLILLVVLLLTGAAHSAEIFDGQFDGRKGTLSLTDANGLYTLQFVGADGSTSLLPTTCQAIVGETLSVEKQGTQLRSITFAFDSGHCIDIEGHELVVKFVGAKVKLQIFTDMREIPGVCRFDPQFREYCEPPSYYAEYLRGTFYRR